MRMDVVFFEILIEITNAIYFFNCVFLRFVHVEKKLNYITLSLLIFTFGRSINEAGRSELD